MEASRLLLPSASLSPSESAMKEASRSLLLWLLASEWVPVAVRSIARQCQNRCRYYLRPRRSFHCRSTLPCESIG